MSCPDNNCVDPVSSNCVLWQGDNIPCLGIDTGDSLTELQNLVVEKVCEIAENTDLSALTLCGDFIALMSSRDKTIGNFLQVLLDYGCTLKSLIPTESTLALDWKCMSAPTEDSCGNTIDYSLNTVLQTLITNYCSLKTVVDNLNTNIVTIINNEVADAVTDMLETCQDNRIVSNGEEGVDRRLTFKGFVPPFCPIPYFGSLTYFDFDGKGLDDGPMCGWYLCNGKSGTPDLRGRVIVGAIQNMGGGTLASEVDPANYGGAGNYVVNDKGGVTKVKLTSAQSGMPSHNHTVNESAHSHAIGTSYQTHHSDDNAGNPNYPIENGVGGSVYPPAKAHVTQPAKTNLTIGSSAATDATEAFDNRMPYIAAYYIMMIN